VKKRSKQRKTKKPIFTHNKIFLGLFLLLFAVLLQVGLAKHIFNFAGAATISDEPVTKKVYLLIFNPTITQGTTSSKLTSYMGWNDPDAISNEVVSVFPTISHGYINYTITERNEVNAWPTKVDSFVYNQSSYLGCWQDHATCHNPDSADFQKMFTDYNICSKGVDEVWVWGGPWFGYPEYQVVNFCGKSQFVMGFSYEKYIDEALHDFGHRMEFVNIERNNNGLPWDNNDAAEKTEWQRFSRVGAQHCGDVHEPPGYRFGYDYSNPNSTSTDCDGFLNYPNGSYTQKVITCAEWECTQKGYMKWWLSHIPHSVGTSTEPQTGREMYNNWWKYYAYYDETAVVTPTNTPIPNGTFSNIGATFGASTATFSFAYSTTSPTYVVDVSTIATMTNDVYLSFVGGTASPLQVNNPQAKWDKYSCGRTLYWRVSNANRSAQSPIQTTTVNCAVPTPTAVVPTPTPTRVPTPTPTKKPTPTPTRVPTPTPTKKPTPTPRDTTLPTVVITSPTNNSSISRSGTTTIKVNAADASGIARVEFYVNNSRKCTDIVSSYTCNWSVSARSGTVYTLTAKAYDRNGNSKVSTSVKVTAR
jgi:hypothetical protein